jgi:hypothetical protein
MKKVILGMYWVNFTAYNHDDIIVLIDFTDSQPQKAFIISI